MDPVAQPPVPQSSAAPLVLATRPSRLAHKGHPWFYRDDLTAASIVPDAGLVRLRDDGGRDLGLAFTSGTSRLAVRRCGPWPGDDVPDRATFFAVRLDAAIGQRMDRLGPTDGVRLVHGEADALPGLVVDRYGEVLVLQVTARFVEASLDAIVPHLVRRLSPASIVARNDVAVRRLEALPQEVRLLHGRRVVEVEIVEHGVRHLIRPWTGHKTGFYLDQHPARGVVKELARGRAVLDLFAYQGAFSLAALAGGATEVLAVDQAAAALEWAQDGARRNGFAGLRCEPHNVFDFLRQERGAEAVGRQWDVVVLDPPAFAKSRRELGGALRGYRDLNRLALRLLAPGGHLLTCSCSHHVTLPRFEEVVRQAAAGLPFRVLLRQRLGAGPDHPAWLALPESEYLKVLLLQRVD